MKCFLSTGAFVASVVMLLIMAPGRWLTAETDAVATSANQPIEVLSVKLVSVKANTIDGLEIQIQNTSARPIQYLVIHAEIPGAKGPIRVPVKFGNAPVPTAKAKMELLQPGAKATLAASKDVCERITKDLAALRRVPSSKEIQVTINGAIFADRSAWANGQMNYPDPVNGFRWIAASELARKKSLKADDIFGANISKADYKLKPNSRTCFRLTGFQLQACCDDMFVMSATFVGDPNGNSQPVQDEACCSPGNCCQVDTAGPCSS